MALPLLLDGLLDSKDYLTLDDRLERPKKGEVPYPKHGDFFDGLGHGSEKSCQISAYYKGEFTQYPFLVRFRPLFYVFASS